MDWGHHYLTSLEILKQQITSRTRFTLLAWIENFLSFVSLKAAFDTKRIDVYGTEWYISIELYKYCQTSKEHIHVTSSSPDQPETLGAFVCGRRSDRKECSFDVEATFKFKQSSINPEDLDSNSDKFCFNSTTHYDAWGYFDFATIDVIFLIHTFLTHKLSHKPVTINFRIFWTSAMAIWLITHLKCSLMSPFLSV